jgi:SAM-dependent methyltransferase
MGATSTTRAAPSNQQQAQAWDGDEGAFWAARADVFERSTAGYDDALLDAARIAPDAAVLDVGCGTGSTARLAARRAPRGSVLGVDLSRAMLDEARRRAQREGLGNVRFEQADAQVHPFGDASFDVVLSKTGAMFFGQPEVAFTNLARALRPDGKLVLVVWQPLHANEWISTIRSVLAAGRQLPEPPPDAPGPFSLSDPDRTRALLRAAGLEAVVTPVTGSLWLGQDVDTAEAVVLGTAGWLLDGLDADRRSRALIDLRQVLGARHGTGGVAFGSAAWLVVAGRR